MSTRLKQYIRDQPHKPCNKEKYRTPILVSDSKGFTLRNHSPDSEFPFELWCCSGARTHKLVDLIEERITKAVKRHGKIVIYLWAGTCDITQKAGKYIRLRSSSNKAVEEIISEYNRAIKIVEKFHTQAKLKIMDCPISSIQQWNKNKGHYNPSIFKSEDSNLTKQITFLNKKIWCINKKLGTNSVRTSQFYFRSRKERSHRSRKSIKISLNNKDGVHPGKLLSLAITKKLLLDSYKECFITIPDNAILQILVEEEELKSII